MSKHKRLDLMGDVEIPETDSSRPIISVWFDPPDFGVTLSIGPTWGNNQRFVDLSPQEARKLAVYLKETADEVDSAKRELANSL